jgi:hypothetical protein
VRLSVAALEDLRKSGKDQLQKDKDKKYKGVSAK